MAPASRKDESPGKEHPVFGGVYYKEGRGMLIEPNPRERERARERESARERERERERDWRGGGRGKKWGEVGERGEAAEGRRAGERRAALKNIIINFVFEKRLWLYYRNFSFICTLVLTSLAGQTLPSPASRIHRPGIQRCGGDFVYIRMYNTYIHINKIHF